MRTTRLKFLERRHAREGIVDIANVPSRLCKEFGKSVCFIHLVGSSFVHSLVKIQFRS